MNAAFEFASPGRVVFGAGRLLDAGPLIREFGTRCLLFTGSNPSRSAQFVDVLTASGMSVDVLSTSGEPTFESVRTLVSEAKSAMPDVLVAMGGGSVIDTAKAVAMLLANGGDPLDYAEVIGQGRSISKPSLPLVAIPTTAGAGAEATRNAVLVEPAKKAKVSLRSHLMLPRLAIIDPMTTISLPPTVTAATGMDALSQLIEAFVSVKANPATDAFCRAGLARASGALLHACECPDDVEARAALSFAAWMSGMALANAGLGAAHGFAAALGGMCDAPHGLICARFLAPVCQANIHALRTQRSDHPVLGRYREVAVFLTGVSVAAEDDGVEALKRMTEVLPLESLSSFGVDRLEPARVIDAAARSSSMKGNPIALWGDALRAVYSMATQR